MLLVYRIDRLTRSIRGLLDIVDVLNDAGVGLVSASEHFDANAALRGHLAAAGDHQCMDVTAATVRWDDPSMLAKVAVLASHTGSNLRALHTAAQQPDTTFTIALIISNNRTSGALAYAQEHHIPHAHLSGRTHPEPAALDTAILQTLHQHQIDLLVTAGYMKKLGPATLAAYQGRILNIHPSLLPRHGGKGMYGMNVHQAVLAAGDTVSGASVHLVTADYDAGPVIAQRQVPVLVTDTPQTLAARVLAAEHHLLPTVVRAMATRYARQE